MIDKRFVDAYNRIELESDSAARIWSELEQELPPGEEKRSMKKNRNPIRVAVIAAVIAVMLIGSAYTLMLGKHVKIDLIFDRFPKKMQLVLDVITSAMASYFCYVVTMQAWKMIQTSIKLNKLTDNMMHIPVWWIQLPLLIGFAMLAVQFVVIILERLASLFGCDCAEQK